jgi:hypothetical protein
MSLFLVAHTYLMVKGLQVTFRGGGKSVVGGSDKANMTTAHSWSIQVKSILVSDVLFFQLLE